jgi:hypothetical protein
MVEKECEYMGKDKLSDYNNPCFEVQTSITKHLNNKLTIKIVTFGGKEI